MGKLFIRLINDNISSQFRSSKMMCYMPSVLLIKGKCPASLLMSYLHVERVQFKLSLDSLEVIYQLNYWKELNLRRQPFCVLTSAQSEKCIVSSLLSTQNMIFPRNWRNYSTMTCLLHYSPNLYNLATICLSVLQHLRNEVSWTGN